MRKLLIQCWSDDCGALIATEWLMACTILVLGVVAGLVAVRQAVLSQFYDMADAILSVNTDVGWTGQSNRESHTGGSVNVHNEFHFNGPLHGPNVPKHMSRHEWNEPVERIDSLPCD